MYVVIRSYSGQGASELFDAFVEREKDVKNIISTVPGFISYEALRSDGGGQTVTVCQDQAGTDESSRRAAEWVKDNVSVTVNAPTINRERRWARRSLWRIPARAEAARTVATGRFTA